MARLEKSGQLVRVAKGVYCRKIKTAFGYYTPNKEAIFCDQLLHDASGVIGYETGLSAMNKIGLISQMPNRRYIATNLHTKQVPKGMSVEVRKPTTVVSDTNYRYLQILDAVGTLDHAPVDTANPAAVIRGAAKALALNTDMMILIARKYYNSKTLLKTIDIMLEGQYETA
jgi:predicted transcriptional regulator of viral defense system